MKLRVAILLDLLGPDVHGVKLVKGKGSAEIPSGLHREEHPHDLDLLFLLGCHDEYVGHTFLCLDDVSIYYVGVSLSRGSLDLEEPPRAPVPDEVLLEILIGHRPKVVVRPLGAKGFPSGAEDGPSGRRGFDEDVVVAVVDVVHIT